jgi:hypothetical protein
LLSPRVISHQATRASPSPSTHSLIVWPALQISAGVRSPQIVHRPPMMAIRCTACMGGMPPLTSKRREAYSYLPVSWRIFQQPAEALTATCGAGRWAIAAAENYEPALEDSLSGPGSSCNSSMRRRILITGCLEIFPSPASCISPSFGAWRRELVLTASQAFVIRLA